MSRTYFQKAPPKKKNVNNKRGQENGKANGINY